MKGICENLKTSISEARYHFVGFEMLENHTSHISVGVDDDTAKRHRLCDGPRRLICGATVIHNNYIISHIAQMSIFRFWILGCGFGKSTSLVFCFFAL